ncbi:hypothetical protein A2V61_01615 [Candidatus Woesebacteria bacterium RBG_19FT_COMBO_47_8]|nr:MAG: hypothetical protein A2V61_01615 [Candidatus Woesebacteria bacterium RBG_19FT_COMBO_47_8]
MNITISDNWLRDYLKTKAASSKIADALSLSGPSVEKVTRLKDDSLYSIEVTTNRVDCMGVYGIAREASAALPAHTVKASLVPLKSKSRQTFAKTVRYLKAEVDTTLCPRFAAVLIKGVKMAASPEWMSQRLERVGVRSINNVVDISNYIMKELGQPVHTFDYDKILKGKMLLRPSRKGETITTLDEKKHTLPGGDIVIEDGKGRLIDLAGIMGGTLSAIDDKTKNVLLFVQTYNPLNIRRTAMSLAHRSEASDIFEKGTDPELISLAIRRGIDLFETLTGGKAEETILDIYPNPPGAKTIALDFDFISGFLGTVLPKHQIGKALTSLGFEAGWRGKSLSVKVPSWRLKDVQIKEDVIEEIARIWGYQRLPGIIMQGALTEPLVDSPFGFEAKVKNILKGYAGIEVYSLSLVAKHEAGQGALQLANPLGEDSSFLRTSLLPSLARAAGENAGVKEAFHLFEMANVYLPRKGDLPQEKMMLAGIFVNTGFRQAKGIIEALAEELNVTLGFIPEDSQYFQPSQRLLLKCSNKFLGQFGMLETGEIYYELDMALLKLGIQPRQYKKIPSHPAQIEDITLILPAKSRVGDVIFAIKSTSPLISEVVLETIYNDAYTFRLNYQHPQKTLTDSETEKIRGTILKILKRDFGAIAK